MKYICKPCDYSSNDLSNYNKHKNTKKHAEKVNQPYESPHKTPIQSPESSSKVQNTEEDKLYNCNYCKMSFGRLSYLKKHLKGCIQRSSEIEKLEEKYKNREREHQTTIKELMFKLKNYEKEIKYLKESKDEFKEENDYHKDLVVNAGKMTQTSLNAVNQIITQFRNAPAITEFSSFELLEQDNEKLGDDITYYYREKKLIKQLGDIIVTVYTRDNPQDQSLWNTDAVRLAYVVREIVNKKPEWRVDKGGLLVRKYAIKPVLEYLREELVDYLELTSKDKTKNPETKMECLELASKLIKDIDEGTIENQLIKYIGKFFHIGRVKNENLLENKGDLFEINFKMDEEDNNGNK